jgi:hypothetical protein
MDRAKFQASLDAGRPPAGLSPPLQALWWTAKGDWKKGHKIVQKHEDDKDCAWVHAHIHRLEGDVGNAAYWYGQAGREAAAGPLDAEREAMIAALL